MNDEQRDDAEREIRAACNAGDYERAATLTIVHYGRELLGFLITHVGDADRAGDVFSLFSEHLWKTLPGFEWRCSARTWAYKLARQAAVRHDRREQRHAGAVPLSRVSRLSQAVARVRTETESYRKTAVKDVFQKLREQLPMDDQLVLVLRVDRGLSWQELAEVMLGEGTESSADEIKREAARLRKRFQVVKDRLRAMAQSEGLLPK